MAIPPLVIFEQGIMFSEKYYCDRSSQAREVYSQSAYSIIHEVIMYGECIHNMWVHGSFPYLGNHVSAHVYNEGF
jgi:hypothetical protein